MTRAIIVGAGAVGARAARQLLFLAAGGEQSDIDDMVVIDTEAGRADAIAESLGPPARVVSDLAAANAQPGDVVLLGLPGSHRALAEAALRSGAHVVSAADDVEDVQALFTLDAEARTRGLHVVIGAGFSPGLTCVLAALGARSFERVEEIHVAKVGTGGPACARQHHQALRNQGSDWRDGKWEPRPGGSGRELCWFPDPVRGVDCYRAALPETALLAASFPGVSRVTARLGATRRDRLTSRLPMLRRPHPEGELGAVRVEVRGAHGAALDDRVFGAVDRPGVAAGMVAALAARWALDGRLAHTGASGLAGRVEPGPFLATLAERGLKVAIFEGSSHLGAEAGVGSR